MIVPEFMRFYGYTVAKALDEFAIAFFSLVNSMYRIQAKETLSNILSVSAGMSGKEGKEIVRKLEKQSKGLQGIIQEVRNIKP